MLHRNNSAGCAVEAFAAYIHVRQQDENGGAPCGAASLPVQALCEAV
jgi:hypothetical protein